MGKVERGKKRKGREINDRSKSGVQEELQETPHFMHYVSLTLELNFLSPKNRNQCVHCEHELCFFP